MGRSGDRELRRALGLPARTDPPAAPGRGAAPVGAFDGGSKPNPGPGGWAAVLPDGRELSGAERWTTNNRMELTAAIRALEATRGRLHLIGDSAYVINGITRWLPAWRRRNWRKADGEPVENSDLWRRLAQLASGRKVTWELVRGHRGHPLNERCDQLATAARREQSGR
ncbi:MAG: ribonuclease HI [Candidatus Eisenbacteria bacterium]|nr:ribonuclease HI [Candidatus Eisenbacteria bacterium]